MCLYLERPAAFHAMSKPSEAPGTLGVLIRNPARHLAKICFFLTSAIPSTADIL
jgi:hypothetical protein